MLFKLLIVSIIILGLLKLILFAPYITTNEARNIVQERNEEISLKGVYGLLKRRVPAADQEFIEFAIEKDIEHCVTDCFYYKHSTTSLKIVGSSLSALSFGLYRLYGDHCRVDLLNWASHEAEPITGCVKKINISSSRCNEQCRHCCRSKVRYRYYLNQVTYSYSQAWWGFDRWEKELDWMSLRGVNLCLAHVAQETIWYRVWNKIFENSFRSGEFFTSVPYLSWNRMGNIQALGNRISPPWYDLQLSLQHKILNRMIELGIDPILPAFNLHVPKQLETKNKEQSSYWSGFTDDKYTAVDRLSPNDPMANRISKMFIQEQLAEYRQLSTLKQTYFSLDIFNEMDPGTTDVKAAFSAVAQPILDTDKRSILVVQMWTFAHSPQTWTNRKVQKFMDAVPSQRSIYLDLHGDKRPMWNRLRNVLRGDEMLIWTLLHNFGGNKGMAGELREVGSQIQRVLPYVRGIGLAMEGIEQNEMIYDYVLSRAWTLNDYESIQEWISKWAIARYHSGDALGNYFAVKAWRCAADTVYARSSSLSGWGNTKSVLELRPGYYMRFKDFQPTVFSYRPTEFARCAAYLVDAAIRTGCNTSQSLSYDVVDFIRQVLSDRALIYSERYREAVIENSDESPEAIGSRILEILNQTRWLLDQHWRWRRTMIDVDWNMVDLGQFEDFKTLFTMWSPHSSLLHSYASRMSAELLQHVYQPRWELFLARSKSLKLRTAYINIEMQWIHNNEGFGKKENKIVHADEIIRISKKVLGGL